MKQEFYERIISDNITLWIHKKFLNNNSILVLGTGKGFQGWNPVLLSISPCGRYGEFSCWKKGVVRLYYIFASQGLRSAPLLSTLGRLSQNFVIPAYRPLADLWSSAHLHYIIINQWERLYYYLFKGMQPKTSVNWANT